MPTSLAELREILRRGEACESAARKQDEQGFHPMYCADGWEYDSPECQAGRAARCDEAMESYCALSFRDWEDRRDGLFQTAMTLYREAADGLRTLARTFGDQPEGEEAWLLLAEALMDIDIHPYSMETPPADLYWEAQSCYLRLYYNTGKDIYWEQARLCEGFRHATVRLVEDDEAEEP